MKPQRIVRIANFIGIISIILLVFWIFTFISIEIFGLKVFREKITDMFFMSILGILALMAGALMVNIMFNLSRIADKHNIDQSVEYKKRTKLISIGLISLFPIILIILFTGDYLTAKKKEDRLINISKFIVEKHTMPINKLADYKFEEGWLMQMDSTLRILSVTDKYFPNISVITLDSISSNPVYMEYSDYTHNSHHELNKFNYTTSTTDIEREYFQSVFYQGYKELWFNNKEGHYELFYPHIYNGKLIILHFSEYSRYGKY